MVIAKESGKGHTGMAAWNPFDGSLLAYGVGNNQVAVLEMGVPSIVQTIVSKSGCSRAAWSKDLSMFFAAGAKCSHRITSASAGVGGCSVCGL